MTRTIATLIISTLLSTAAIAADKAPAKTIVKKADLPELVGSQKSAAKYNDGIPTCFGGDRAVVTNMDAEPMLTWNGNHQNHPCFGADKVYVCRAGKNLSVRCEAPSVAK